MKKITAALAVAAIATTASIAFAGGGARTGINGSMHDINNAPGNYTHDKWERTCVFCHTPHNAQKADDLVPLWNHKLTSNPVMQAYAWVSPANAKDAANNGPAGIGFASDPLVGPSRLCMACHDGSTAVDSHGTAGSDVQGTKAMTASYLDGLGNTAKRFIDDLTVTHPIGFLWEDAFNRRGASEIAAISDKFIDDGQAALTTGAAASFDTQNRGNINRTTNGTNKTIQDVLYGGYMTCATCHDVHNSINAKPESGHNYNYFLYAQEEGSAICLSCHIK